MKRRDIILGLLMLGMTACASTPSKYKDFVSHCKDEGITNSSWREGSGDWDSKCLNEARSNYKIAQIDNIISLDPSYKPFRQAALDSRIEIGMPKMLVVHILGKPGFTRHLIKKDINIEILKYSKSLGYSKAHIYVKSSVVLTNGLVTAYKY